MAISVSEREGRAKLLRIWFRDYRLNLVAKEIGCGLNSLYRWLKGESAPSDYSRMILTNFQNRCDADPDYRERFLKAERYRYGYVVSTVDVQGYRERRERIATAVMGALTQKEPYLTQVGMVEVAERAVGYADALIAVLDGEEKEVK